MGTERRRRERGTEERDADMIMFVGIGKRTNER